MTDGLHLTDLAQYYGTEQYHRISPFKSLATDGVVYIMQNGYSWFVTDSLAVIEHKLSSQEFLHVRLMLVPGAGVKVTIDDGNGKILHTQSYPVSSAKRDLDLFWEGGVLMLVGER
jgi:hypothetical protein